jgi:hypothetical protein
LGAVSLDYHVKLRLQIATVQLMNSLQFQRVFFFQFVKRSLLVSILLIWFCWAQIVNNLLLKQLDQPLFLIQLLRLTSNHLWKLLLVCFGKLLHLCLMLFTKSPQRLLMLLNTHLSLTLIRKGVFTIMLRVEKQLLLEMIDHGSGLLKLIIRLSSELVNQEHFSFHWRFEVVFKLVGLHLNFNDCLLLLLDLLAQQLQVALQLGFELGSYLLWMHVWLCWGRLLLWGGFARVMR